MTASEFRERWRNNQEGWQRLRWARTYWQMLNGAVSASAADAAASLNMEAGTYRAYEREPGSSKTTRLNDQAAIRFGRKFKVDWQWLLTGEGTPFDNQLPEAQERVVRAMSSVAEERQEAFAAIVETLFGVGDFDKKTGTRG